MFAMYLDIQKGILIEDLPDGEVKGRWKSFIRKWCVCNRRFFGISYLTGAGIGENLLRVGMTRPRLRGRGKA